VNSPATLSGKGLLTPVQRAFLSAFSELPDQSSFYLTGGTALAEFYLAHRISFDLDFFTAESQLILPFSYQLEALDQRHDFEIRVVRRFATYVEFIVNLGTDSLRIDLALDSPFRFATPMPCEYGVLVNVYVDLPADKLPAYYGRAEPRDAVDLYFVLQREPVGPLLDNAMQKDPGFDLYWFAVALGRAADFPDELARWPVKMLVDLSPTDLKQTFERLAIEVMGRLRSEDSQE
jgi:hypothetical protein